MIKRPILVLGFAAALFSAAGFSIAASGHSPAAAVNPANWEIGPVIRGENYSHGTPPSPSAVRGGGFGFTIPRDPGSVHYVTFPHGPLTGKTRISLRYRIDAEAGVEIKPITAPQLPSILTLYFQRGGDDWSGRGAREAYRWYATFASVMPLTAGEHTVSAPLDGNWTAVERSSARNNPRAFAGAKAQAERVGFVLGGGDGYGHGVFATGKARLVVLDFKVE